MKFFLDKDISMSNTLWNGILLFFGLNTIYARLACIKLGIKRSMKLKNISNKKLSLLDKNFRKKKFLVGRSLERELYLKISKLIQINCYRGSRARQGLPIRGQRTHSNAKTSRKLNNQRLNTKFAKRMLKMNSNQNKFNLDLLLEATINSANTRIKTNQVNKFKKNSSYKKNRKKIIIRK